MKRYARPSKAPCLKKAFQISSLLAYGLEVILGEGSECKGPKRAESPDARLHPANQINQSNLPLPEIRVALGKVLVVKAFGAAVEHVPQALFPERRRVRLVDVPGDLRLTPGL